MTEMEQSSPDSTSVVYVVCQDVHDAVALRDQFANLPGQTILPIQGRSFDASAPALVVTGANVLIAVISALLSYINAKQGRTIHIKGANGFEVTVPSSTSREELDRLVKLAASSGANSIVLASTCRK